MILDLFSGTGSATVRFAMAGHQVLRVEKNTRFSADARDVTGYHPPAGVWGVWASPPCTEFARESMPWCKTGQEPSLDLLRETVRIIQEARPAWWIVENVKGAIRYFDPILNPLGAKRVGCGAHHLWVWPEPVWAQISPGWKQIGPRKERMPKGPERSALPRQLQDRVYFATWTIAREVLAR